MATNQYQEQWMASAAGRSVDPDGAGGFQCVDVPKDYAAAIFGKPWTETIGYGNAKDLLWGPSDYYWHKIANDDADPDLIPQRGDVVVYGGNGGSNPYGHIAVVLDADASGMTVMQQDGFLQCPMYVGRLKYWEAGAGSVIGWLRPNFDDDIAVVPESAAPAANVRVTGPSGVKRREEPSINGALRDTFEGDKEITLAGYVRTSDPDYPIWFKGGLTGGWMWAGGFTDQSLDGLTDLTPPEAQPLAANQRITGEQGAILRGAPATSGAVVDTFMPDRILTFSGYVHGTAPGEGDSDVWFVGISGNFVWSGALTDPSTTGLTDLTPVVVPTPPATAEGPVLYGIDVANYQRDADLATIPAQFIIIKATEGVGWTDPELAANVAEARRNKGSIGFYHFARPNTAGGNTWQAELDTFLTAIKPYLRPGDRVFLDFEAGDTTDSAWAKAWLDGAAAATNSVPCIYLNTKDINGADWSAVEALYPLWYARYLPQMTASYSDAPAIERAKTEWAAGLLIWQFTSRGRLAGWDADLDLNVLYGGQAAWDAGAVREAPATPAEPSQTPSAPAEPTTEKEPPVASTDSPSHEALPAPTSVSPKVLHSALIGALLTGLAAILAAITPETLTGLGPWAGVAFAAITLVGQAVTGYLKSDPLRDAGAEAVKAAAKG